MAGQLGHRLLTGAQQLQQAAAVGLNDRSHQVSHSNTLVFTNAYGKSWAEGLAPGPFGTLMKPGRPRTRGGVDDGNRVRLGSPSKRLV